MSLRQLDVRWGNRGISFFCRAFFHELETIDFFENKRQKSLTVIWGVTFDKLVTVIFKIRYIYMPVVMSSSYEYI